MCNQTEFYKEMCNQTEFYKEEIESPDDWSLEKCGRCGCSRMDHTPACKDHLNCKKFSPRRAPVPKKKK